MFVRLTLADVKEGEMNNALEYVKNTVMPSYDGISGLLGICLLYTSPSPRDPKTSRMPSSA